MKKIIVIVFIFIQCVSRAQNIESEIKQCYMQIKESDYIKSLKIYYQLSKYKELASCDSIFFTDYPELQNNEQKCQEKRLKEVNRYFQSFKRQIFLAKLKPNRRVLALRLQIDEITNQIQVDSSNLPFDVYWISRFSKGDLFVHCTSTLKVEFEKRYASWASIYCLDDIAKDATYAFKHIMRLHPQYILSCQQLDWMNTILYLKDDKIYVYRILEKEHYELNSYIQKFGLYLNRH